MTLQKNSVKLLLKSENGCYLELAWIYNLCGPRHRQSINFTKLKGNTFHYMFNEKSPCIKMAYHLHFLKTLYYKGEVLNMVVTSNYTYHGLVKD